MPRAARNFPRGALPLGAAVEIALVVPGLKPAGEDLRRLAVVARGRLQVAMRALELRRLRLLPQKIGPRLARIGVRPGPEAQTGGLEDQIEARAHRQKSEAVGQRGQDFHKPSRLPERQAEQDLH